MSEPIYQIYKITNLINHKNYIGITKEKLKKRYWMHTSSAKRGSSAKLHKAIRKYGKENLEITAICCIKGVDGALELEKYFIKEFDSFRSGYNCNEGGTGILFHSEESKLKMRGRPVWNRGKPMREESKKKLSESMTGVIRNTKTYEIITPEKEIVMVNNLTNYCRNNSLSAGNMCSLSKGKLKYYKGYHVKQIIN